MVKSGVKVVRDDTAKLLGAMKTLTQEQCLVGIPATTTEREPEPDEAPGVTNAMIGYIMEFGSPAQNIPARPHLVPGVESVRDKVEARYKAGAKKVLDGDANAAHKTHEIVGLIASSAVKSKITEGPFVPLSPKTLADRRRRGRKGERPLIDTGQYRNAQTYVVRPKG